MSRRDAPSAAFLAAVAECFEAEAREEGTRLALRGDVHSLGGDATYTEAVVLDSPARRVWVGVREGAFEASCDCPQRARGVFCRHLWALIVRGVSKGYLGGMGGAQLPAMRSSVKDRPLVEWREAVGLMRSVGSRRDSDVELMYYADPEEADRRGALVVRVATRRRKKNGELGVPQTRGLTRFQIDRLGDPDDLRILELLLGADGEFDSRSFVNRDSFVLSEPLADVLVPLVVQTGRFVLWDGQAELPPPCRWEDAEPWAVRYSLARAEDGRAFHLSGRFERDKRRMPLTEPDLALAPGFLFRDGVGCRFRAEGDLRWLAFLRRRGPVRVPAKDLETFLSELFALREAVPVELPRDLKIKTTDVAPRPRLALAPDDGHLAGTVSFDYDGHRIDPKDPREILFRSLARGFLRRRLDAEREALAHAKTLGLPGRIDPRRLAVVVDDLVPRGWRVEGEAGRYRAAGKVLMSVTSGVDWFDVEGGVDFGGKVASFPQLLAALRSGEGFVRLGDGSVGLLPEDWLRRHGLLLAAGEKAGKALRYRPHQAVFLDALLAAEPQSTTDSHFEALRAKWRGFEGVAPADPPPGFQGELREYQRAGLGWLHFLREHGLGGVLADDMGLGKTVQALAFLEARRQAGAGTSLVVVPRSLLHNWKVEAERFAPQLRVLEHWGLDRARDVRSLKDVDLVLTTYGTLRADAPFLKDRTFDCVILDEAQSIKNAQSATAKAARLLKGEQRLALSGTPIENHLGELWSLMEFLNPGLLGRASIFHAALAAGEEGRVVLARALRPFILRRTKDQVAPELPARTEHTVLVELDRGERSRYDELKAHYRKSLLSTPQDWGKTKFNALEALLRLRQAACHPGLLDPARRSSPGSKLDALLVHLRDVVEEGRKALVFSQFTSFLGIVREALDAEGIAYAYLDGQTRDRAGAVAKFRECPVFLISLKAGGLGLNLTEAEVVFLLDPWWNPAVEAQAIDRTHRIGQTRPVFAYRLVAKDTVEEKVLELQRSKRELADAILGADPRALSDLTRDDLERLLS